jgi:hypothetical protein
MDAQNISSGFKSEIFTSIDAQPGWHRRGSNSVKKFRCFLFSCTLLLVGISLAEAAPVRHNPRLTPLPALENNNAPGANTPPSAPSAASSAETVIYNGETSPDQDGLVISPWGNGAIENSTDLTLDGSHSLLVTTVDSYQGALISLKSPVDLGDMRDKSRYLEMTIHFAKVTVPQRRFGGGRFGGGRFGGGRFGGGRFGGGRFGNQQAQNDDANSVPTVTRLRWVFTLANGEQAETERPLPDTAVYGDDWVTVAVPLSILTFSNSGNMGNTALSGSAALQSILVAADGYAQFSVGDIKVVTDTTPITAVAGPPQTVGTGEEVIFNGQGDGGDSSLLYAWDFDTHGAFVDQAEGQTISTRYYTAGKDYTVTLRVSDVDGIKPPAYDTTTVHVR